MTRWIAVLIAVLLLAAAGCGGDDEEPVAQERATTAEAIETAAPPPTTPDPPEPQPEPPAPRAPSETDRVREAFVTSFRDVSWFPPIERIEGIFGGWLYIETNLHSDNPDTDEVARSICSGGLAIGLQEDIDGFRGVSVFGVGSRKIKECRPYEPVP